MFATAAGMRHSGHFFHSGPDLVKGITIIEDAVFHHVLDIAAVINVVPRILVQGDKIRNFANPDSAQVFWDAQGFSAQSSS